jgi:JAB1/Mov34/MPN/PAD-1 ubiquitin protease
VISLPHTHTHFRCSADIAIHPLVVISIADQHTRTVQQYPQLSRVFGLLYGRQDGRTVTVHETVEIAYTVASNHAIVIGEKALEVDVRLCT